MEDATTKTERVHLRVTAAEKSLLQDLAKAKGLTVSEYLLVVGIQKPNGVNKELLDVYRSIIRNAELKAQFQINRTMSYHLYVDKNALKRVFEAARFSRFMLGDINMDEVNAIIDNFEAIYELMPERVQALKGVSMKELRNCRNKNYLMKKLNISEKQVEEEKKRHSKRLAHVSGRNLIEEAEKKNVKPK